MKREQLEELVDAGWELAAHSATLHRLTELDDGEVERELARCQKCLAEITGDSAEWFAYPYGSHNLRVREKVRQFFNGACTTELAFTTRESDPFPWSVSMSSTCAVPGFFQALQSEWLVSYLKLRHRIRKARGH